MPDIRLKIAVFIDFDNIEIGVKNTLNAQFDIGVVLEALKERGDVVSKTAYGDWTRAGDYSRSLTQHATKLVQRNLTPGGDKNGADINLALDALEMAFTHTHISAYVIVGGDSDFISLVEKLKQYDKQIFVVGGRSFTSQVMQRNCHEFIAYENLIGGRGRGDRGGARSGRARSARRRRSSRSMPLHAARAEDAHRPRGHAAARAAEEHAAAARLDVLRAHLRRQQLPRLRREARRRRVRHAAGIGPEHPRRAEGGRPSPAAPAGGARRRSRAPPQPHRAGAAGGAADEAARRRRAGRAAGGEPPRMVEAIAEVRRLFQSAQNPPRWPMYVRQVKQFLRGVDPTFDERKFGFTEPQRSAARLPEGRPVPDGARPPGRRPLLPGQRAEGTRRSARRASIDAADIAAAERLAAQAEAEMAAQEAREREAEVVEGDVVRETEAPRSRRRRGSDVRAARAEDAEAAAARPRAASAPPQGAAAPSAEGRERAAGEKKAAKSRSRAAAQEGGRRGRRRVRNARGRFAVAAEHALRTEPR